MNRADRSRSTPHESSGVIRRRPEIRHVCSVPAPRHPRPNASSVIATTPRPSRSELWWMRSFSGGREPRRSVRFTSRGRTGFETS